MNPRHLIDQLVRQMTVLIAQLSTTAGIRAPLAHVADQVFVELSREIESQGISRKVAADMFGLALRTYQTRVQRLSQSQTMSDRTLWQAVLDFVAEQGNPSRARIVERFRNDGELAVGAVLNDLTTSGLISVTGKGANAICRVTSDADRRALSKSADADTVASLLWVQIYRDGPLTEAELRALWPDHELLERALGVLVRDQRVVKRPREDGTVEHSASAITIAVGDRMGWEGAVLDHFQAVAKAIAHKLRLIGASERNHTDLIGGATLTFDLSDGHPLEAEVKGLLKRVRDDANALWNRLKEHNEREPIADDQRRRVVFSEALASACGSSLAMSVCLPECDNDNDCGGGLECVAAHCLPVEVVAASPSGDGDGDGGTSIGCGPNGAFVSANVAPDQECIVSAEGSAQLPIGLFDVSSGFISNEGSCNTGYRVNLLAYSCLQGANDTLQLHSAEILLKAATGETIAFDRFEDALLPNPFLVVGNSTIFPMRDDAPSSGVITIEAIPAAYAEQLDALDGMQVHAEIRVYGRTVGGSDVDLNPFLYPINICDGCLTLCAAAIPPEASLEEIYGEGTCRDNAGADGRVCVDASCLNAP